MISMWLGFYLFHLLAPPNDMPWWAFPFVMTATVCCAAEMFLYVFAVFRAFDRS